MNSASARATHLRLRCEAQREQLAAELAEIERSFESADAVLMSIRNVVAKPSFILSSVAMLLLGRRRRNKWGSLIRRGLFWYATGRRVYQAIQVFKNRKA
jgi:hypothetical protein